MEREFAGRAGGEEESSSGSFIEVEEVVGDFSCLHVGAVEVHGPLAEYQRALFVEQRDPDEE
ncbi:hypothetical protein [Streptomyces sp. NBC_01014]|uniref:hypothetical protein n=1 Tax=Streptomyces sp. NBC_01014 TaxID=2903719 RepID=UPI00386309E7|nr:hypothetical protein OG282_33810 [Streptomyces sp. NBC_01014]